MAVPIVIVDGVRIWWHGWSGLKLRCVGKKWWDLGKGGEREGVFGKALEVVCGMESLRGLRVVWDEKGDMLEEGVRVGFAEKVKARVALFGRLKRGGRGSG